jgi:DNA-binding response OmpR family regulator
LAVCWPRAVASKRFLAIVWFGRTEAGQPASVFSVLEERICFPEAGVGKDGTCDRIRIMHVLVVEDERKTAMFIRKALLAESFAVDVSHNGPEALMLATRTPFDAIVLDIMLPGRDGLSVLRELRQQQNATPILLLSARGQVDERVEGLNAGADDYLPKPFALEELIARVRSLGRRRITEAKPALLCVADLSLDTNTRQARRGGNSFELTTREYRLLEFLMRSAGRICGRMTILEQVWEYNFDPGTNLVDVYVKRLREKIDDGFEAKLLHTVRGTGYVLKEP